MKEKFFGKNIFIFQSPIAFKTFIEDFWAQAKTIRPSAKWSMLLLTLNLRFFPFWTPF